MKQKKLRRDIVADYIQISVDNAAVIANAFISEISEISIKKISGVVFSIEVTLSDGQSGKMADYIVRIGQEVMIIDTKSFHLFFENDNKHD